MAANLAGRPNVKRHHGGLSYPEFGASFINIMLMIIVIVGIVTEALARLQSPPNVAGGAVVWIALVGLIVNLIVAMQLQHQAHEYGENLNNQAAYLHVLGDLLGSIAAIVAGAVIYFTGWQKIDPILSLLSALLLVVMTVSLAYRLYTRFSGQAHD
jgi:cobalt-zinc-cadmium efflux system protein